MGTFQLDDAARLLSASKTMFYLDYHAVAQKHGTAGIQTFVEAVLRARSDLDKSDVKTIVRIPVLASYRSP